jgi:hypothetical protein
MARGITQALWLAAGVTLLAGCNQDQVVGRYRSAVCEGPGVAPEPCNQVIPDADVSIVTIPTAAGSTTAPPAAGNAAAPSANSAPSPLTSATNFPDHALAEYIHVLADPRLSAKATALRQNLAASLKSDSTDEAAVPAAVDDQTVLHRTLTVTVSKDPLRFNPADRIEAAEVAIDPLNGAKFTAWDTAATLYTTINAGSIQLTQARNTGQSLTVGTPTSAPIAASLGLTASQANTRVETFNAASQVDNLTVSVFPDGHMRIRRQGGVGIDLTGNTIVKVDLRVPDTAASYISLFSVSSNYQDAKGQWVAPASLKWKESVAHRPIADDLFADVSLIYTIRHIVQGDDTVEEKDDVVHEITMKNPSQRLLLVPGAQVAAPVYSIWTKGRDGTVVYISRPTATQAAPFCLGSYDAAQTLLAYLQHGNPTHPQVLGNATLGFSHLGPGAITPLTPATVADLTVRPECP